MGKILLFINSPQKFLCFFLAFFLFPMCHALPPVSNAALILQVFSPFLNPGFLFLKWQLPDQSFIIESASHWKDNICVLSRDRWLLINPTFRSKNDIFENIQLGAIPEKCSRLHLFRSVKKFLNYQEVLFGLGYTFCLHQTTAQSNKKYVAQKITQSEIFNFLSLKLSRIIPWTALKNRHGSKIANISY